MLALSACNTDQAPRDIPPSDKPDRPSVSRCVASEAQDAVGKEATPAAVEQARRSAGAQTVRVLKPDQVVTMEFREGRLNVHVDANNVVTRVACG